MATLRSNPIINGFSRRLGNHIVFRNLRGKTIVAQRPAPAKKQSEQQKANRSKFREATEWARQILTDPRRKEYYQKKAKKLKLPNAYTAAITDYMRSPELIKLNRSEKGAACCVSKKDSTVKKIEIIKDILGTRQTRVLKDEHIAGELRFSEEDLIHGVEVVVTDAADIVRRWNIRE
jgi:hypothetical protein